MHQKDHSDQNPNVKGGGDRSLRLQLQWLPSNKPQRVQLQGFSGKSNNGHNQHNQQHLLLAISSIIAVSSLATDIAIKRESPP